MTLFMPPSRSASGALSPPLARHLQLLADAQSSTALLARWTGSAWHVEPLPDQSAWQASGWTPAQLQAALAGWWERAQHEPRFAIDPSAPANAWIARQRRPSRLLIQRLESELACPELLCIPLAAPPSRKPGTPDYQSLLTRVASDDPAPAAPAHQAPPTLYLRTWESLADALQQSLILVDHRLTIHYLNTSAQTFFGSLTAALLGTPLHELAWDPVTRKRLERCLIAPESFQQSAELHLGHRLHQGLLRVRPMEGGGLICEFLAADELESLSTGPLQPWGSEQPHTPAPSLPPLQWAGMCGLQPLPITPDGLTLQTLRPAGGGQWWWMQMTLPKTDAAWTAWAQGVWRQLEEQTSALVPVLDVLQELLNTTIATGSAPFAGVISAGRLAPGYRTFEWGTLGPAELAHFSHRAGGWQPLLPERVVYVAHGCPVVQLYRGELLPGEGLLQLGHRPAEGTRPLWQQLPGGFPRRSWDELRRTLRTPQPGGGLLLRTSPGVTEIHQLYPPDFPVFSRMLGLRLAGRGADEHTLFQVRVALDEILTNAFRHGHGGDPVRPVQVEVLLEPGCLRLGISDQGPGYDLLQLRDPTSPEAILENGGRGVFLARQMMDLVEFGARSSEVRLTKYFGLPPAEQKEAADSTVIARLES